MKFSNSTFYKHICVLCLLSIFLGCKTIKTTAPTKQVQTEAAPTTELSTIQLPIQIPLAPLNAYINKIVPNELYYGKDIEYNSSITATVRVLRNGPINIEASNGVIRTSIPIKIVDSYVLFDYPTILFGNKKGAQPFSAAATVTALTNLGVDRQWNITAKTISSFVWNEEPKFNIAGFNIPIGTLADNKLNQEMKEYLPLLDQYIRQSFDLKSTASSIWTQLSEPVLLIDSPAPLWLTIRPREFNFAPLSSTNGNINLNVGLKAFIETSIGAKPAVDAIKTELLPLNTQQNYSNSFAIHLPIDMTYCAIAKIARQQLVGKQFAVNEKIDIIINDLDFYSSAGRLAVMADVFSPQKGIKGKVYLLGTPLYNAIDSSVQIVNVDFDINTKNVLLKSAKWLLYGKMQRIIEQQAVFSLRNELEEAKKQLETSINTFRPSEQVHLQAKVKNFDIRAIHLGDSTLKVYLSALGELKAEVVMQNVK